MREYRVVVSKNDFSKLRKHNIYNIKRKADQLIFYTDEKSFKQIQNQIVIIEYENILRKRFKSFFKKNLINLISLFIIVVLLINQSIAVREIKFTGYNTYDEEVESFLLKRLKKVGPFYYLDDSLNNINFDLKSEFYQYEWVSVSKNGSFLEVDIKKLDEFDEFDNNDGPPGDYIAKKDANIQLYHVKQGVLLISQSQSVSKGDVLITGNLKHWVNEVEYIRPHAIVIGEVLEYKNVKVKKERVELFKTGKIESKKYLSLFNHDFNKDSSFDDYHEEEKTIFNFFNFIKVKEKHYYEKENVKITYTKSEALEYAKSLVVKDFNPGKHEKVIFINLLETIEDNNTYYFRFIVKKHENIAEFVPVNIDE